LEQLRKRIDEFKQTNAGRLPQPAASNQLTDQQKLLGFGQDMLAQADQRLDQLRQQQAQAPSDQHAQEIKDQEKTLEELAVKLQLAREGPPPGAAIKIEQFDISGITDSSKEQLLAQLPVHVGDPWSPEAEQKISQVAGQFDVHLMVGSSGGGRIVRIFLSPGAAVSGEVRVGSNVMAANLINPVKPVYPQLAKMARVQGTVQFEATIGTDGTIQNLKVVAGPPLLIQAAMDAVKQWHYKPTVLNGTPAVVITTIDVNFALADGPPQSAQ